MASVPSLDRFQAQAIWGILVNATEQVWRPQCGKEFPCRGYLRVIFRDDRAGLHAAALATHYRHDHTKSHDRAWSNPRYASKIPDDDYELYKAQVNNQAKRRLLRAIAKQLRERSYPEDALMGAVQLIRGFRVLQENDEPTKELIERTLEKAAVPLERRRTVPAANITINVSGKTPNASGEWRVNIPMALRDAPSNRIHHTINRLADDDLVARS